MKFVVDLSPVVVFFGAYHWADMYVATVAVMIACLVQTFGYRLFGGSFDKNHLLALGLVLPFGAATLAFRDPAFIKWNGTVELWILAAAFAASHLFGDRPLVQRMLGHAIELPDPVWRQLNLAWAGFMAFAGGCNIAVAYTTDEATWVNFRLFGMTGLTLAFIGWQMWWLTRRMSVGPNAAAEAAPSVVESRRE